MTPRAALAAAPCAFLECKICPVLLIWPNVIFYMCADRTVDRAWYFGSVAREESERLLSQDGTPGCFLIRESHTQRGQYSLSLYHKHAHHCRIYINERGEYYLTSRYVWAGHAALLPCIHTGTSLGRSMPRYRDVNSILAAIYLVLVLTRVRVRIAISTDGPTSF